MNRVPEVRFLGCLESAKNSKCLAPPWKIIKYDKKLVCINLYWRSALKKFDKIRLLEEEAQDSTMSWPNFDANKKKYKNMLDRNKDYNGKIM